MPPEDSPVGQPAPAPAAPVPGDAPAEPMSLAEIQSLCSDRLSREEFYETLSQAGLGLGDGFRWVLTTG